MPTQFLFAFFWGLGILAAFLGWGSLAARAIAGRRFIAGLEAAFGLSLAVAVGGLLNLFSLVSRVSIFLFLGTGLLIFIFEIIRSRSRVLELLQGFFSFEAGSRWHRFAAALVLAFVLVLYSLSVFNQQFHGYDDYQTYLGFPAKMLQTGSLGEDPYSETRVVTSLGGKYFLDTFVLSVLPWNSLHLIDNGVGLLMLVLLVWGMLKKFQVENHWGLLVVLTVSLLSAPSANVTSTIASMVLFLALLTFFFREHFYGVRGWRAAALLALLLAAFLSLKSNTMPVACLLAVGLFIADYRTRERRGEVMKEYFIAAILVLVLLLPWMLSLYQSAGTLLYPVLGRGFHGSAYGTLPAAYEGWGHYNFLPIAFDLLGNLLFWLYAAVALALLSVRDVAAQEKSIVKIVLAATGLAVFAGAILTGGYGVYRYSFAYVYPTVIFFIMLGLKSGNSRGQSNGAPSFVSFHPVTLGLIAVGILLGSQYGSFLSNLKPNFDKLAYAVTGDPAAMRGLSYRGAYLRMQEAVPLGEILLVRLEYPFLLDFTRNTVYLTDYIGGASPPPGIPIGRGPEPLAEYLVSQNVRYVAYSYATQIGFTREIFSWQLPESGNWRSYNRWLRAEVENTLDFQDNLNQLGQSRLKVYDDGDVFVLDLIEKLK